MQAASPPSRPILPRTADFASVSGGSSPTSDAAYILNKNSVADALLVELYAEVIEGKATDEKRYGFVTFQTEVVMDGSAHGG